VGGVAQVRGVGTDPLNVRAEPSAGSAVVTTLSEGARVRLLEGPKASEGHNWWRISRESGIFSLGWAIDEYLAPVAGAPAPAASYTWWKVTAAGRGLTGWCVGDWLVPTGGLGPVASAAAAGGPAATPQAVLPTAEPAAASPTPAAAPAPPTPAASAAAAPSAAGTIASTGALGVGGAAKVSGASEGLNVRSGPTTGAAVVGVLANGENVQ